MISLEKSIFVDGPISDLSREELEITKDMFETFIDELETNFQAAIEEAVENTNSHGDVKHYSQGWAPEVAWFVYGPENIRKIARKLAQFTVDKSNY